MTRPLLTALLDAWRGRPPEPGGDVDVVRAVGQVEAVVAFTGRAVAPELLLVLARGGVIGVLDLTLVAPGTGAGTSLPPRPDLLDHPRVAHASRWLRRDIAVWGDERGLVTLAEGLAGRREMSVEAFQPGAGTGRSLVDAALGQVPAGEPVFAAVSPGDRA